MIFKLEMVKKILAGQKTQTRRPAKRGEETCRYRVGRTYGVQRGRGKRATARIEITANRLAMLHAIDDQDARREGFEDREAFLSYWEALHGDRRDKQVWVISFVLASERTLYLARPVPGRRGDYTTIRAQAIDKDAPAVSPDDLIGDSDLRFKLLNDYKGWEPEDVLADCGLFRTTDNIKDLRRSLDLRGIDGLPQPTAKELERVLVFMVEEGRSVREVALAMDCSTGQAHKLIHRTRARRAAA